MIFSRLWHYIIGYVIIIVEGGFMSKFLNICTRRGIALWNITRNGDRLMVSDIGIRDFKKLPPVVKKCGCRVRIQQKKGIPFILYRYRRRKFFAVGIVLCVICVLLFTSYVWQVDVVIRGEDKISEQMVVDILHEMGIYRGAFKHNLDTMQISREMILKLQDAAWIGINIHGTKVSVDVVEKRPRPAVVPLDSPCDIIAARDGVIRRIVVSEGTVMVKTGQPVRKGQILVSSEIKSTLPETLPRYVHSNAQILATTWFEEKRIIDSQEPGEEDIQRAVQSALAVIGQQMREEGVITKSEHHLTYDAQGNTYVIVTAECIEDIGETIQSSN